MSLCSICRLLCFFLHLYLSTVSPSASLTWASQSKCNGCPAASVSDWQAYSRMWAGNLTARRKCQMYYRSILIHAVFSLRFAKSLLCSGGVFFGICFATRISTCLSAWGLKSSCCWQRKRKYTPDVITAFLWSLAMAFD